MKATTGGIGFDKKDFDAIISSFNRDNETDYKIIHIRETPKRGDSLDILFDCFDKYVSVDVAQNEVPSLLSDGMVSRKDVTIGCVGLVAGHVFRNAKAGIEM